MSAARRVLARAAGLGGTLLALLAAVFACLHAMPRAPRASSLEAAFAPAARREAERAQRAELRAEQALPLFVAWPPFDRRALVAAKAALLREPAERELAVAWLAWLGPAARAEWTRASAERIGARGIELPELGLPADEALWAPEVLSQRIARAFAALREGGESLPRAEGELAELGPLLLEPIAAELQRRDAGERSELAPVHERLLRFAERLPQVALSDAGELEERRARWLAWWDGHAVYFASAPGGFRALAALRETRFARWIGRALRGDLGRDRDGRAITSEIARRLGVTMPLAAAALLLAFGLSLPAGACLAARRAAGRGAALERALLALHAAPGFWLALLLLALFAGSGPLGFLPGSWSSVEAPVGALARARHALERAALPVLALALPAWAYLARQRSAALRLALEAPFARAARARGLGERELRRRHAAPHARFAVLALLGAAFPALVSGSLVVETVFEVPGLGRYAYEGLLARDLPRVLALTALAGIATWLGLELAEAGLRRADPRRRGDAAA